MYRVLEITTGSSCAVGCRYCPQDKFALAQRSVAQTKLLDLESFRRCLESVPSDVDISFSGYVEPWLNPECTSMVEYASEKGHGIRIFSTLVGMSQEDLRRLALLRIKLFVVHVFDDGTYMKPHYVSDEYIELLKSVIALQMPSAKFLLFGAIHPKLKDIVPSANLVQTRPLISRGGSVNQEIVPTPAPLTGALLCQEKREYRNVLLPNGDVSLCCMDFERRHVLGNLLTNDYAELHSGAEFQQVLRRLDGDQGFLLCRTCEYAAVKKG